MKPKPLPLGSGCYHKLMRNTLTFFTSLFFIGITYFVHTTLAANRTVFTPRVPEMQIIDWLKKNSHDAEELEKGRYRIYYRDYENATENDPKDDYGHYTIATFDWGPPGGLADVFVSSKVERVPPKNCTTPDTGLPEYRYHYQITSLEASRQEVRSLWIRTPDLPKNWQRDISNPPGWKNYGQPPQHARANNGITWTPKFGTPYISPGTTLKDFNFKSRGLPSIIMMDIRTSGADTRGSELIETPYRQHYSPRGHVVGPAAIPINTSPLALTRRLESLTSQSVTLGWLDTSAAAPLQQHLTNTITAFGKNQHSQAKLEIQRFVEALNALEKQSPTAVSSGAPSTEVEKQNLAEPPIIAEALTLLKTNAAYLLTKF